MLAFVDVLVQARSLLLAPFSDPLMFWEIGPLLFTVLVIELYFGRYKREQLGWNSSVSNSLVLVFVGSNLLHFLFLKDFLDFSSVRTVIPLVLIGFGVLLVLLDFFHIIPEIIAFRLSGSLFINMTALMGIIIVHTGVSLSPVVVLSCLFIIFVVTLFFALIRWFEDAKDA